MGHSPKPFESKSNTALAWVPESRARVQSYFGHCHRRNRTRGQGRGKPVEGNYEQVAGGQLQTLWGTWEHAQGKWPLMEGTGVFSCSCAPLGGFPRDASSCYACTG